jgi:hypothetical protein
MAINVLDGQENSSYDGAGAYGFGRGSANGVLHALGAAVTTGYFGFHFKRGNFGGMWWQFSPNFTVGYDIDSGVMTLYRGENSNHDPGWTVITTVATAILDSSLWHWCEGSYTVGDSGTFSISINGVQAINLIGADLVRDTDYFVSSMYLHSNGNNNTSYDNIYHFDSIGPAPFNNNIGEFRIVGLFPTAAGTFTQFTPSVGANYTCVDEVVYSGDTDFVYSDTAPKKDTYNVTDYSGITPTTIYAVTVSSTARKDDTSAHTFRNVLKSGVVVATGAIQTVGNSYVEYTDYFTADPNDGALWTVSKINAMEIGVELLT